MRDGWEQRKEGNDDDPNLNKVENAGNGGGDLARERNMCKVVKRLSKFPPFEEHRASPTFGFRILFGLHHPLFDSSLLQRAWPC